MKEFERIAIGQSSIPSLVITVILMIAIPVVFFLYWRRKHRQQTRISWLVAGMAGFMLSARVLELGVHYCCVIADNPVSRFINGSTAVYVLYGITMAGVFEECGRHIMLKHFLKKNRTRENAVLYGIGHGGVEALAVVLPSILLYLAAAVLFSTESTENALRALNITEETAAAALPTVQAAAAFDYGMMAMNTIERLLAMLLHIALTVIVYAGIVRERKAFLPLAILLHMLTDTFHVLYQRGVLSLWSVEVWVALLTAITLFIAVKLYRTMNEQV